MNTKVHFPPSRSIAGTSVSTISLGCMNLSHAYGNYPTLSEASALIEAALDSGITMLDTAALYGDGENERLLGKVLGAKRREIFLASKCVLGMRGGKRGIDGSPEAISEALNGALRRLQTDHIDLYYLHRLDPAVPIEESVGALVRAKEAGKIGALGLSEMSAPILRRAHAVHPIAAMQSEYSPAVRNPEVAVLEACEELGAAFVAFSPLARGLLAGAVRNDGYGENDIRRSMPRFTEPLLSRNLKLVDRFNALAASANITPAQLSLAWVVARYPNVIAIPGTRSRPHLAENIAVISRTITSELIDQVTELFPYNAFEGPRYSASAQKQIDTEFLPDEPVA